MSLFWQNAFFPYLKPTSYLKCRGSGKNELSKNLCKWSLFSKYRQLLGKYSTLFKRGECIGFYTINSKIKFKNNNDPTKIIGHNIDLIQHFLEALMQAIKEEKDSQRNTLTYIVYIYMWTVLNYTLVLMKQNNVISIVSRLHNHSANL